MRTSCAGRCAPAAHAVPASHTAPVVPVQLVCCHCASRRCTAAATSACERLHCCPLLLHLLIMPAHTSSRQATAICPFVQGPDAAGRPVLRILIGAAVTECRGNAALAFANAILTHMEQASAGLCKCCESVVSCLAMQMLPRQQPSADVPWLASAASS